MKKLSTVLVCIMMFYFIQYEGYSIPCPRCYGSGNYLTCETVYCSKYDQNIEARTEVCQSLDCVRDALRKDDGKHIIGVYEADILFDFGSNIIGGACRPNVQKMKIIKTLDVEP